MYCGYITLVYSTRAIRHCGDIVRLHDHNTYVKYVFGIYHGGIIVQNHSTIFSLNITIEVDRVQRTETVELCFNPNFRNGLVCCESEHFAVRCEALWQKPYPSARIRVRAWG